MIFKPVIDENSWVERFWYFHGLPTIDEMMFVEFGPGGGWCVVDHRKNGEVILRWPWWTGGVEVRFCRQFGWSMYSRRLRRRGETGGDRMRGKRRVDLFWSEGRGLRWTRSSSARNSSRFGWFQF